MAKLFNVEVNTINYHLKEIFESFELNEEQTIRKIRTVQNEGNRSVSRELAFYSLDAIIAVGYRVNSKDLEEDRYSENLAKSLFIESRYSCLHEISYSISLITTLIKHLTILELFLPSLAFSTYVV